MKKILILEDDHLLAQTLAGCLASDQIVVVLVSTLKKFYLQLENQHFDLCVMDRMIEQEDSLLASQYARDISPTVKILFLSKKGTARDRIDGLEAGADDYLPKPFSLAELKLRVKNLLTLVRDNQSWGSQVILDEIIFYPTQGIIQTPEKKLILRRRETQIMECLTNAGGALVSRHQLIRALWPPSYQPNSSTVDVYIRRLRQKLGVYHAILQTRRGFGYRVVLQRKV